MKLRGNKILRFIDRYVGIFLLHILPKIRRKMPENPKRIGILKLGGIGDLIVLSGVIRDLQGKYEVVLFHSAANAAIVPMLNVKTAPLKKIRSVDILIDAEQWSRVSALLSFLSGAYTIGFQTPNQYRHRLYNKIVPHLFRHEVDNFRALVAPLITSTSTPHFDVTPQEGKYVVFHPWPSGTSARLRRWPLERWCELAAHYRKVGYTVYFSRGPQDPMLPDSLTLPLSGLARYLAGAYRVVTVDTAIVHLAAAVDARITLLNGPVNPLRWGPLSKSVRIVQGGTPYFYLGSEVPKNPPDNMGEIQVEDVLA